MSSAVAPQNICRHSDGAAPDFLQERVALQSIGRIFYERGWSLATSSNYSVVVERDPLRLLLTASGKHKGQLTPHDFVLVDQHGRAVEAGSPKPSAETLLHCVLAKLSGVGSILHTHSVWSTLLSDVHHAAGGLVIEGYEMLKGLEGIKTHEHRLEVPIFENTQDIPALAAELVERLADPSSAPSHAFLIRRHGLYTWGRDVDEARRHVEALEFLFEVVARRSQLDGYRHYSS
jgi:methylthioribulose-1-phosphate dehydratase